MCELLFNIAKHAHAYHAGVFMKRVGNEVPIKIEDNNSGMQATIHSGRQTKKGGVFGLSSIQKRLKISGGRLETASDPGKGTSVNVIVPLQTIEKDRS